ncbi:MAG: prepilin-type N-terminal cleavage/methylation domain-containing protein [Candidatus Sumerlaeota bacterium]|nr:prepilin-type N-terminal cleavage/methylation domain-containing protein [Candidatus Sumerlaeota bacterium]
MRRPGGAWAFFHFADFFARCPLNRRALTPARRGFTGNACILLARALPSPARQGFTGNACILLARALPSPARRGFTILETLIAMAIFLVGVVAILNYYPLTLRTTYDAADLSIAALLAQYKAEEIRRDDDQAHNLMNAIRGLAAPTTPMPFAQDSRLAYQFFNIVKDPISNPGVKTPVVIVSYNAQFRSSGDKLIQFEFQE